MTFAEGAGVAALLLGGGWTAVQLLPAVGKHAQAAAQAVAERAQAAAQHAREKQIARQRQIDDFWARHRGALARRRLQLIAIDAYGGAITEKWDREKRYFMTTVLAPFFHGAGVSRLPTDKQEWETFFGNYDRLVEQEAWSGSPRVDLSQVATGQDYETFCADRLNQAGWLTSLTKASGDQGVDIIAIGYGLRVVCQCKFYTSPVGNKAVQEAVAARLYERANFAVVISNAAYTQSAETLARTTGTILIHHDDIPSLRELIGVRQ